MDCDSAVTDDNYLRNYFAHLHPQKLLYGGRIYRPSPPQDRDFYFHWKYGSEREVTTATIRQEKPYHSFMTNNFLIPKKVFEQIGGFDERLRQYGHEDTVFGLELQRKGVEIMHLDNPLAHIGLERTNVFLSKTKQGVGNLQFLVQHYPELETRLLLTFKQIQKYRLGWLVSWVFKLSQPFLLKNFHSRRPRMIGFDFYKLGLLLTSNQLTRNE